MQLLRHYFRSLYPDILCGYGVATISRLIKIISRFCKRALLKRRYSVQETCNFKEPINRSHSITVEPYMVATISRLLKIIGLFCTERQYSAKETHNFKEPTKRSHSITVEPYGVATISRLLKIIGLFFRRDDILQKRHTILRSLLIVAIP